MDEVIFPATLPRAAAARRRQPMAISAEPAATSDKRIEMRIISAHRNASAN